MIAQAPEQVGEDARVVERQVAAHQTRRTLKAGHGLGHRMQAGVLLAREGGARGESTDVAAGHVARPLLELTSVAGLAGHILEHKCLVEDRVSGQAGGSGTQAAVELAMQPDGARVGDRLPVSCAQCGPSRTLSE